MAIKLTIFRNLKQENKLIPYSEKTFPDNKHEIKFGRGSEGNDVVLKDESRQVSGQHAVLSYRSGKFFLTDLKSTNKTSVNGKDLPPHQPLEVNPDSRIEMANFLIKLAIVESDQNVPIELPVTRELKTGEPVEKHEPETDGEITPIAIPGKDMDVAQLKPDSDLQKVAEELRAIHKKYSGSEPNVRRQALLDFLKLKLQPIEKSKGQDFLAQVKKMFPDPAYSLKALKKENEALKKKAGTWAVETGLPNSTYTALSELANKLIEQGVSFQSENDVKKFCENIKNTVESLINSFSDLDKGRKRILEDFIDIWDQKEYESPLLSKTPKEMFHILLDWRNHSPGKMTPSSILEKSLQILIIHEISLLKGYQEATYRGSLNLLEKLDPKILAYQIGKRELNLGFMKIPYRYFPPLVKILTWREYLKRHQQWTNEDARKFEEIFRPSFAAKYKEIINRSKQTSRNLNETRTFYRENLQTIKREVGK